MIPQIYWMIPQIFTDVEAELTRMCRLINLRCDDAAD